MKYTILILLILVVGFIQLYSQENPPPKIIKSLIVNNEKDMRPQSVLNVPQEVKDKCVQFFELLVSSEIKTAFERLLQKSPISKREKEVKNLIEQTEKANELYGKLKGYEAVNSESPAPSYIRMRYITLHTDTPMRWLLTFYKSPELGWIIVNVKFDDLADFFFKDE